MYPRSSARVPRRLGACGLFAVTLALGGCLAEFGADDAPAGAPADAVKNGGAPTRLREAVGKLESSASLCSGTLIAPDRVLTAAHCFEATATFTIELAAGGAVVRRPVQVVRHERYEPGVQTWENFYHDIMVVKLDRPITEIKPMPLAEGLPGLGHPVEIVGYGMTAPGERDAGTKRLIEAAVTELQAWILSAASLEGVAACGGDSGGAVLRWSGAVALAAIISHGDAACTFINAVSVAPHRAWLEAANAVLDAS